MKPLGRIRRIVIILAAAGIATLSPAVIAQPAWALFGDCKNPPVATVPGRGLSGWLLRNPDNIPAPGDPFAEHPTTTIYEQYGWSGFAWPVYDPGCGGAARDPGAYVYNTITSSIQSLNVWLGSLMSSVVDAALHPTWAGVFDPVVQKVSDALRNGIFTPWAPIAWMLTGVIILCFAAKWESRKVMAAFGGALIVTTITITVFSYPVKASRVYDTAIPSVIGDVSQTLNGNPNASANTDPSVSASSVIYDDLYVQQWIQGLLGCTQCPVAKKYGGGLFDASHITWAEKQEYEKSAHNAKDIQNKKKEKFKDLASKVQDEDPDAYGYLAGKRGPEQLGASLTTFFGWWVTAPFIILASGLVIAAFLIAKIAVELLPLIGLISIPPKTRKLIYITGEKVLAAGLNSIAFFVGGLVNIVADSIILNPATPLPGFMRFVLCLIMMIILWVLLKPATKLLELMDFGHEKLRLEGEHHWFRNIVRTLEFLFTAKTAENVGDIAEQERTQHTPDTEEPLPYEATPKPDNYPDYYDEDHLPELTEAPVSGKREPPESEFDEPEHNVYEGDIFDKSGRKVDTDRTEPAETPASQSLEVRSPDVPEQESASLSSPDQSTNENNTGFYTPHPYRIPKNEPTIDEPMKIYNPETGKVEE